MRASDTPSPSRPPPRRAPPAPTAQPPRRNCLGHRHVCIDVSPEARGLFISIDLCPEAAGCGPLREPREPLLDVARLVEELRETLGIVHSDRLRTLPGYETLPADLLGLRHVALGGRSEPTRSPRFVDALEAIVHLRALRRFPFFKLIVETHAAGLDRPEVLEGLRLLTPRDEVWVRLDPDDDARSTAKETSLGSMAETHPELVRLAHQRPVILQGYFSARGGEVPGPRSIEAFAQGLKSLRDAGAQIPLVHIHTESRSATPPAQPARTPLPLRTLFQIARQVRSSSGLPVEVF